MSQLRHIFEMADVNERQLAKARQTEGEYRLMTEVCRDGSTKIFLGCHSAVECRPLEQITRGLKGTVS
jgi:hypothetical protein